MYQQSNPPLSPKEILPTMYDLPSETLEDQGLPDEFHLLQPELLRVTFLPPDYPQNQVFVASDLNLYYDPRHPQWYKRPDWFAVLGVSRLYEETELRLSYVTWQEGINPFVAIELISPGTESEDLGQTLREINQPPNKWEVYERILRIPYYFVYNRYNNEFQGFGLTTNRYQNLSQTEQGFWLPEVRMGLGLWQGSYQGIERLWLRWYDEEGNWLLTPTEREQQRADQAEKENQRLRELLRQAGVEIPDDTI
ncbi:Uma2 family endonuclease [Geminocystis sp. CENA526]|uniref:Uma2 family endonuclease n=1 Tax=Geminocystis sp. CENA526 TaxID=1355871 RepID=UPI003D6E0F6C